MPEPHAEHRWLPLRSFRLLLVLVLGIFDFAVPLVVSSDGSGSKGAGQKSISDDGQPYKWKPERYWPSIFVAIFSRRSSALRRATIRRAWKRADFEQDKLLTRFALCSSVSHPVRGHRSRTETNDGLGGALQSENETYGDIMLLNCTEGYGNGLLTRKTLAAMQGYTDSAAYSKQELFMKIDDDTFAAWSRLWPLIAKGWESHRDSLYMGTMKEPSKPTRDPFNTFYEPRDTYPKELYPKNADGGPGYIIGGSLVRAMMNPGIAPSQLLYNEDKAVAVWLDSLVQRGEAVHYINIEGQTGYAQTEEDWQGQLKWFHSGRWVEYPLILHHRLTGTAISCLSEVEFSKNPNATIDRCFTKTDNAWIPMAFQKQADGMGAELWLQLHGRQRLHAPTRA